jgi:SAM-dependent methyltransferase
MDRLALVRPLEEDWRDALDAVARSRSWPTSRDVARLASRVVTLSAAYNDPARASASMRDAGPARLGFSFVRDVPKGAAAVRELVSTGAVGLDLRLDRSPLRVLDVGAGLGATTWGLVRALAASGAQGRVEATWLDSDPDALALAAAIVRARDGRQGAVELRVQTRVGAHTSLAGLGGAARFDVVLLGHVLSELDVTAPDEVRVQRHVALLRSLFDARTEDSGALVVIEPALRNRTRHLHRVRDALAASGATIFAPCLHARPCPALARDSDWCHEDLAVDLPSWLVPVATAAGLRREGLTFSYLVLHRGGRRLAAAQPFASGRALPDGLLVEALPKTGGGARLRVVSDAMASKGKLEAFVCGELQGEGGPVAARARLMRLNRDATADNDDWGQSRRGDVIVVNPAPELGRARIHASTSVSLLDLSALDRPTEAESR